MEFWTAVIVYVVLTSLPVLSYVMAPSPKPLRGIYRQAGRTYIFKYVFFYLLVTIKKLTDRLGLKRKGKEQTSGYGVKVSNSIDVLDGVHELPQEYKQAVDAVYFVGVNQEGFGMLASGARRHNGLVQSSFELVVPGVGVLLHPKLPDTSHRIKPENEKGQWHVDGLEITPIQPGRKWHLRRSGPMRLLPAGFKGAVNPAEHTRIVNVEFEAVWEATSRIFDTDSDIHMHSLCDSVARENWDREFFKTLEQQHQTHLEQFGEVKATISIEGFGDYSPRIQCLRDHTFGKFRDWCEFHRYAIFYLFLGDGSGLNLTVISRPGTMSRLAFGYRVYADGELRPIPVTDLDLARHDEKAIPRPGLSFQARGGGRFPFLWPETYDVRIQEVWTTPAFYIGNDRDAQINDSFLRGTINGKPCWGISEWMEGYHGEGSTRKELYQREDVDD